MAVDLTLKSVQITNREATPLVLNSPQNGGAAPVSEVFGHLASVTASLSITSVIRLVEVPSNARINSVKIYSGAQTAGKFDVGVYQNNANGGAVVDADLFASAVDCASAVDGTELIGESGQYTIAEMAKPLWEVLGLSSDPKRTYDIAATVVTTDVTTGTGALAIRAQYSV
jgi:hypothetical protein